MNIEQAKWLPLPDILAKLGHLPVKEAKGGRELWYPSPFREEKDPSFHISIGRSGFWIWKDFGDIGGTVIDFAMRYRGFTQVRDALTFLEGFRQANTSLDGSASLFSFHQQAMGEQNRREAAENFLEDRQLEFLSARPVENRAILNYLNQERCIPVELIHRYLQEVRYRNRGTGKEYFAFGMANDSGGYEIRVASSRYNFKSALKARDISLLKGGGSETTVSVFEGMTDFLSLLALYGRESLPGDAIIMHSLSSHQRTVDAIWKGDYVQIRTYLDNNGPGQEGTERLRMVFGSKVVSLSEAFLPHTDLNDALRAYKTRKMQ